MATGTTSPAWWPAPDAPNRERTIRLLAEALGPLRCPYAPFYPSPKQEAFLRLTCLEAFYGGAAGPGKSSGLLMAALQYVDVPGYAALLLRKSYADLSLPGALMPMAHHWLDGSAARWDGQTKTWHFPSGASLTFGYLDNTGDEYRYKGSEFQFIGFDELSELAESQYTYLFSRLRRARGGHVAAAGGVSLDQIPLRVRSASNPGGPGHEWVKARFVSAATRKPGVVFIPARMTENPGLDIDAYEAALAELGSVERKRLREGDWDVAYEGRLFKEAWWSGDGGLVSEAEPAMTSVRAWDLAASEASESYPDPDYTVAARLDQWADGTVLVSDVRRVRTNPGDVDRLMLSVAEQDGASVRIIEAQDPGQAGKNVCARHARMLAGYTYSTSRETGTKETRARPFAAGLENRAVRILRADWTPALLAELRSFPDGSHDDQVDAISLGLEELRRRGSGRMRVARPHGLVTS